jgi:hypothetical protein
LQKQRRQKYSQSTVREVETHLSSSTGQSYVAIYPIYKTTVRFARRVTNIGKRRNPRTKVVARAIRPMSSSRSVVRKFASDRFFTILAAPEARDSDRPDGDGGSRPLPRGRGPGSR